MQTIHCLLQLLRPVEIKRINADFKLLHRGRTDNGRAHESTRVTEPDGALGWDKAVLVRKDEIRLAFSADAHQCDIFL